MSELWTMLQRGAGVGAWAVGLGLVLVIALPVLAALMAVITRVMGWRGKDDEI